MVAAGALAITFLLAPDTAGSRLPSYRVAIRDSALEASVKQAVAGARRRMEQKACAGLLSDLEDEDGRPLDARVAALRTTAPDYVELVHFRDGSGVARCQRTGILAVTMPGSRVVWMCPRFALEHKRDPGLSEAVVLHEVLHTLGLGENPPTPAEITTQVVRRCGR
ncbi:MAG TPA: hypothetical protein VFO85_15125 [Vicinamibacteria bacterium]|nr:hypothetical protein [Vicinamibacteria bacterium]